MHLKKMSAVTRLELALDCADAVTFAKSVALMASLREVKMCVAEKDKESVMGALKERASAGLVISLWCEWWLARWIPRPVPAGAHWG